MSPKLFMFIYLTVIFSFSQESKNKELDLFVFIGQSNMAGRAKMLSEDEHYLQKVQILNESGRFVKAVNPLNSNSTIKTNTTNRQRLGIPNGFLREYFLSENDSVRIIVQARGGIGIKALLKGSDCGYYESIINRIQNAERNYKDSKLKAIFFHQGESDISDYSNYLYYFQDFANDFRSDLNAPNLPIIVGEIGHWVEGSAKFRIDIQQNLSSQIPGVYLVSSKDLQGFDEVHFDRKSILEFGSRYYREYKRLGKIKKSD